MGFFFYAGPISLNDTFLITLPNRRGLSGTSMAICTQSQGSRKDTEEKKYRRGQSHEKEP